MKPIKRLFLFSLTLMFLLFISFSAHASSVEVVLQQQESTDLNMIRYIGKISGLEYTEIKDYSVTIAMYSSDGTKVNENTKNYTTLYSKVKDVSEVAEDKVYYAVFTLSGLNKYSEYRLDCHFSFNLYDGTQYQTNHKYYEIGTKYNINCSSYAGYTEGCYMEFYPCEGIIDPTKYVAEYRSIDSNIYTTVDNELIRYNNGLFRVDYVGLKEGKYVIRVYTVINGIKNTTDEFEVVVTSDDRSGYAHFNYTSGVGAYNDDGTLKSDTLVVYVNDSNKNSVKLTYGSKTYTGLGNILANASNISVPLDIRIIGTISTTQWNKITYSSKAKSEALIKEQMATVGNVTSKTTADTIIANGWNSYSDDLAAGITTLDGLTSYFTYGTQSASATGYEYDSCWNMMNVSNGKNITIEGIGTDAGIFQWGFVWKKCNSIEVKNLTFDDYTEDACSFEGTTVTASTSDTSKDLSIFNSSNLWIHNCTFEEGLNNWDLSCEKDKGEGDGSTDIKYVKNITISYNKYVLTHKTGLVGGGSNHLQANITFHHNFYDTCQSRMPYARQANMHIYNNYYKNSTGTTMQIYAGAYAFVEGCYFQNDNKAFDVLDKGYKTPAIKSFNNIFDGSKTTTPATIVTDRTTLVTNGNLFNQNFDTDSDFFYYDSENKRSDVKLLETAEEAKNTCIKYSGVLTSSHYNNFVEEDNIIEYTITFMDGDSVYDTQVVSKGSNAVIPQTPTKDGYTFLYWALNGVEYDFNNVITGNLTLNSVYSKNSLTTTPISESITYNFRYSSNTNFINPNASNTTVVIDPFTFTGNGKLENNGTGWTYFNSGSTIKFLVADKASIVFTTYDNASDYTITGNGVSSLNGKYYVNEGEVTITSTANIYFGSIEIIIGEENPNESNLVPTKLDIVTTTTTKVSNTSSGNGVYYTNNFKEIYFVGDSLDVNNLYAVVTYDDNTTNSFNNEVLTITGFDSSSTGKKTITVNYESSTGSVSSQYVVYVIDTEPSIVNDTMMIKVSKEYTGTIGKIVEGYNMFNSINQALTYIRKYSSFATNKYLFIDSGTYNEKVEIDVANLHIVGNSSNDTIIEYNSLYGILDVNNFTHVTDSTMTVAVRESAINCVIENITISNYYNHIDKYSNTSYTGNGERALALLVQADKFIMKNSRLLGWQDTLETFTGRQYFYNTYICGAVDFIFGTNSTTYFQKCQIEAIKSKSSSSSNSTSAYITAYKGLNKNISDAVTYGAIFDNCDFTTSNDFVGKVALARPWTVYSAVAVINSTLDEKYLVNASETIKTGLAYEDGSSTNKITSWNNVTTLKIKAYNVSPSIVDDISGVTVNLSEDLATNYSNFSVIFAATNGGVKYSDGWTPSNFQNGETEVDPPITSNIEKIHNFTESGINSDYFTISGNLSTSKGTVSYDNLTLTQCLKIESATSISFTAEKNCTLTLVFVEPAATIKIDGTKYTSTNNGIISVDLSSGTHTITKADTANLFYIVVKM